MRWDEELLAAARHLHREWDSPALWPAIAADLAAVDRAERNAQVRRRRWRLLAATAGLILAIASSLLLVRQRAARPATPAVAVEGGGWALTERGLSDVERAEAQYIAAIDALAAKAAVASRAADSPLLPQLRERLLVIDAAIAECRVEVERNRFNSHLRRQLLAMYQEKRRTLEQILAQERHAS